MHSASHSDILLVSATLVVIAVVAGFLVFRISPDLRHSYNVVFEPRVQAESIPKTSSIIGLEAALPQENLSAEEYQEGIKNLLSTYGSESLNYYTAKKVYEYNLEQLFAMSVPSGYQQFHFDLVVAFEDLRDAVNMIIDNEPAALSALEDAREKMDLLLQQHTWIKQ